MLFLGCFSFDVVGPEPQHGHFTCIVEADSPDDAVERFGERIDAVADDQELFADGARIYLDDIIGLPAVPADAALIGYVSQVGARSGEIGCALPMHIEGAEVYGWNGDNADDDRIEPFMVFGEDDEGEAD